MNTDIISSWPNKWRTTQKSAVNDIFAKVSLSLCVRLSGRSLLRLQSLLFKFETLLLIYNYLSKNHQIYSIYHLKTNFSELVDPFAMYVNLNTLEFEEIPSHSDLPDSDYQKFLKEKGIIVKEKNVDSKLKLLLKQ